MNGKIYYTYILECKDKSFYVGVTNNLDNRLQFHNDGVHKESYTYNRRPVILVYHEEFQYIEDAINREKQWKGWSRKKKQALIDNNYDKLIKLSQSTLRQAQGDTEGQA